MRRDRRGFTLVEIMMAMLILAAGILLLANSWSGGFARVRKTQVNTEIAALLERKMTDLDIEYRGKPIDSIPEEKSDDFGADSPGYRWKMESKEFDMPDLTTGLTARAGGASQSMLQVMKTLSDHLKKTIREVKVTIYYKPPSGKEITASASVFFIDYDKEVPIPGMGG